jgi:hypothetical protein
MLKKMPAFCALITTACATWQTEARPVSHVVAEASQDGLDPQVRVELASGQRLEIYTPSVVGDSIIGLSERPTDLKAKHVAVATSDIQSVARRKTSAGLTLVTLGVIGAVVLAIVATFVHIY